MVGVKTKPRGNVMITTRTIAALAGLATAGLLAAGCASGQPAGPPPIRQVAAAHGWLPAHYVAVPAYPVTRELIATDKTGQTVDLAEFKTDAARDKWMRQARAGVAQMLALGMPASTVETVKFYQGPDWAAVDEGLAGVVAGSLGG
jgi:hypothetical protein